MLSADPDAHEMLRIFITSAGAAGSGTAGSGVAARGTASSSCCSAPAVEYLANTGLHAQALARISTESLKHQSTTIQKTCDSVLASWYDVLFIFGNLFIGLQDL